MNSKSGLTKREHIMDVAESLFARSGVDGVSVREITDEADVRLASVNYYFQTKENLYMEVLARRAIIVVIERRARLEKIDFAKLNNTEAITEITKAIIEPLMERVMSGDTGWQAYLGVIANFAAKPLPNAEQAAPMNEIDKISLIFIDALRKYSTAQSNRKAHHAFQFITGACLMVFSNNGRLNTLSENQYRSDDYQALFQDSVDFIVGGALRILI